MPRTVLATIHTRGTPQELAYGLLALSHRPEIANHVPAVVDASGAPVEALLLIAVDENNDGGRRYHVRLVGPDDGISSAREGDSI